MPPVDNKEIDRAQILYGSFIKNGLKEKYVYQVQRDFYLFINL